ncbi:hypothetical protein PT277_05310 [Acetobacteraceae bacterium ESL0709]|nr:hypothetical protein [Acetobacteraceae bacterium ESL0697]MDF7678114.1 hypothetical protein [Acetobacteraceae bacterium ESL0709]
MWYFFGKGLYLFSLLLFLFAISTAEASAARDYQLYMERAKSDSLTVYKKGGLDLLNQYVTHCYGENFGKKTLDGIVENSRIPYQETPGFKVCYLVDSLAYALDRKRRHLVEEETGTDPGPASLYFDDKNAFVRSVFYAMSFFPTIKEGQDLAREFTDSMIGQVTEIH